MSFKGQWDQVGWWWGSEGLYPRWWEVCLCFCLFETRYYSVAQAALEGLYSSSWPRIQVVLLPLLPRYWEHRWGTVSGMRHCMWQSVSSITQRPADIPNMFFGVSGFTFQYFSLLCVFEALWYMCKHSGLLSSGQADPLCTLHPSPSLGVAFLPSSSFASA